MKNPEFWWKLYQATFCLSERFLNNALCHPEATEEFILNAIQKLDSVHFEKIGKPYLGNKMNLNASKLRLLLTPSYCHNVSQSVYEYALEHPACDKHVLYKIALRGPVYLLEKVITHEKATDEIKKMAQERIEEAQKLIEFALLNTIPNL